MLEIADNVNNDQITQPVQFHTGFPMEHVHEVAREYHFQSPAHFELEIEAQQTSSPYGKTEQSREAPLTMFIDVLFYGTSIEGRITVPVQCHVRRLEQRSRRAQWECLVISSHRRTVERLDNFLASTFPVMDARLQSDTVWRWWLRNGKSFNWTALPTELKERTIKHCMHQPYNYGLYSEKLARFDQRYKADRKIRKPGPFEVIDQLGDWFPLLYVSHQVRTITFRLCLIGGSNLIYSKGLCITASSYASLRERVDRLGQYYQLSSPSSIPTSPAEEAQSKTYARFPNIYPHLAHYATLRHGIQKISISMDFLSLMRFFKVTARGFHRYHQSQGLTYDMFERLPFLNEIVVRLPLRPYGGWRHRPQAGGPQLWHADSPCPRALHRLIYERIAELLAAYKVTVLNFLEEGEKQVYEAVRQEAVKALKFTERELQELYAETDGGVALLEGENLPSIELTKARCKDVEQMDDAGRAGHDFFPPRCHCNEPCTLSPVLLTRIEHP